MKAIVMKSPGLWMFLALFALMTACRFGQPLGQDEISHYYKCSYIFYHEGFANPENIPVFSPHLYPLLSSGVCKLLGRFNPATVQLTGCLCWLAVLCLLWKLAETKQERWVACGLCAFLPMAQQAAVTVEIDQTVLPIVTLLLCWRAKRFMEESSVKNGLWLASSMALALWGRLTTPIVLIPLFVGFAWWSTDWRKAVKTTVWLLFGCVAFFETWRLYCLATGVKLWGPFEYLVQSFQETTVGERASGVSRLVQNMLYLVFWGMNPFLLVLTVGSVIMGCWKQRPRTELCYLAAGVWLLCGYEVVGGALFGFPKYQMPAMPLICLGIALAWKGLWSFPKMERREVLYLGGLAVLALLAMAFLGDPLFAMRITVRETAVIGGSVRLELMKIGMRFAVCWGTLLVGFVFVRRQLRMAVWQLLLFCVLWTNGVYSVWQGNRPYATGYVYGDEGETQKLAMQIVDNKWMEGSLLVPHEILFATGDFRLIDRPLIKWMNVDELAERIVAEKPPMIALGVLTDMTWCIKGVLQDEKLQKILHSDYEMRRVGRYYVWYFSSKEKAVKE